MNRTYRYALWVILTALVYASCSDVPVGPEDSPVSPSSKSAELGASIMQIHGAGQIGIGLPVAGQGVQTFDMDVRSDLTGYLDYTDYSVVRSDGSVATLAVDTTDPGTAITLFRDTSAVCDEPTVGVEYEGTGRLDTGELVGFSVIACDYADAGATIGDLFSIQVPSHSYSRNDRLSEGDLSKDTLQSDLDPICEATGAGRCFYIDATNGGDTSDGSFADPWKSLSNIVSYYGSADNGSTPQPSTWIQFRPGDYVYVLDGVYSDTYNYNGSIQVALFRSMYGSDSAAFHVKAYSGHAPVIDPQYAGRGVELLQSSWWEIDGFEIRNAWNRGLRLAEVEHVLVTNMRIHDTDDVDSSSNISGLEGLVVSHVEVAWSTFHDNYSRNSDSPNNGNMTLFNGSGGGLDIKVHDNLFYYTNPTSSPASGSCLKYKHGSPDPASSFEVYDNTFRRCKFFAVSTGTQNSHIHHNLIYDGAGLDSRDLGGNTYQVNQTFEYNTIHGGGFEMDPQDSRVSWASDPQNIVFRNNIVYELRATSGNQELGTVVIGTYDDDIMYTKVTPELHFADNCYYNPNVPLQFILFAAGEPYGALGGIYTFAEWQNLGFGYDTTSLNADPQFVDPANGDFTLQSGSPCQGMGYYAGR